jgi:hypothetical protein
MELLAPKDPTSFVGSIDTELQSAVESITLLQIPLCGDGGPSHKNVSNGVKNIAQPEKGI